ncbi:MAG: glycosyltransferase family 1 protein [Candidatus Moraniibacteriota bacterium]
MKIGIDARFYGPIGKGLGRYTQKLIEHLEKISAQGGSALGGDAQYFVFLKKENFDEYIPQNKNFKKVLADYPWYSFSEQIFFPRLLRRYDLDLMHFPHFNVPIFYRKRFVVTVHDLILIHFPTIKNSTLNPVFYKIKFLAYRLAINFALKYSEKIITVSNFTKNDILNNYKKISSKKIRVTHEACDDYCMLSPNKDEEIIEKYGIIKPYIIYIGNAYPHKNLERLVNAFYELRKTQKGLSLVLVGKKDYFYLRLENFVKKKKIENVVFSDYVPDYHLDILQHNAAAYVFPSLYEGFGLPPLEAMAKGVPVVSSDHPCMKEILGESAYFFDGKSEKAIRTAIEEVLTNEELRTRLIREGYQQIRKYNWKKMAQETLEIYKNILKNNNVK